MKKWQKSLGGFLVVWYVVLTLIAALDDSLNFISYLPGAFAMFLIYYSASGTDRTVSASEAADMRKKLTTPALIGLSIIALMVSVNIVVIKLVS